VHAIQVTSFGGPEVLVWTSLPDPEPGPGQVVVQVAAAGINFIDVYRRTGLYQVPLPSIPGAELAGTVVKVGPGVSDVAVGDRVATSDAAGGYTELALVDADRLVPIPAAVSDEQAAAVLLQGVTAQYLVTDTFPLTAGQRCLVHAAAGGVGPLLVQLAKTLGAEVFATVGSAGKAETARAAGADHVIVTAEQDFVAAVQAIAGPRPLDVVYDGVGKDTFAGGLALLRRRGTMVTFGNASGPVEPISPLVLAINGSLFLTRPMLNDYTATAAELRARAADVLDRVGTGTLQVRVGARFPLAEAEAAHRLLESRKSTGKIVLTTG
jgi:NADPH2:quinone reductase